MLVSFTALSFDLISLREVFDKPGSFEGREIAFEGEVVGDFMSEGEGFWVNVRDGNYFIGVFISAGDRARIKKLGRYRVTGDRVKVSGIFYQHCREHIGENDVHANVLEIVRAGEDQDEEIDPVKVIVSFALGMVTILFLVYSHRREPRQDTFGKP